MADADFNFSPDEQNYLLNMLMQRHHRKADSMSASEQVLFQSVVTKLNAELEKDVLW